MLKASHFRLDWRAEFTKLSPFLKGRGGVVRVEYDAAEAAPDKFNHIVKENFGVPGNKMWTSMRIDPEWFTTRRAEGILDELDRLLGAAGFPPEQTQEKPQVINLIANNDVHGNLTAEIHGNTFHLDHGFSGHDFAARLDNICRAMQRYLEAGGHFMIVVNDAPLPDQSVFWQKIWSAGLSKAAGKNLLLLIHTGPKSGKRLHQDSPGPDEHLFLPGSIKTDETRQDDVYDDLLRIFKDEGVVDPADVAATHLASNLDSVLNMHVNLGAAIMELKKRRLKGRTA